MKSRVLILMTMLALASATAADAQIIRPTLRRTPAAFVTLGIGWAQLQSFCDNASGACWNFAGNGAPQWRASFELPLGYGGTGWGVVGTLQRAPLVYSGGIVNSCGQCDADATVSQILGVFRASGGTGFHQVIDVSAGAIMFSNFRASTGEKLGSGKMTSRFAGNIAYGFGYGTSERREFFLEQEYGLIILPRNSGTNSNMAQQTVTRIGLRLGIGDKRS